MKYSLYFFLLMCIGAHSQNSIFIKTGKNLTNYSYTNEFGSSASNLSSEFGNSYSMGYSKLYFYTRLRRPIRLPIRLPNTKISCFCHFLKLYRIPIKKPQ